MVGNQKELNPYLYPGRNCTAGSPAHVTESLSHYRTQRLPLVHSSSFSPLFPQQFYFWPVHCGHVNQLVRWKLSFPMKKPTLRASLCTRAGWVRLQFWPTPSPSARTPPAIPAARVVGQSWWPGATMACPCPLHSPSSPECLAGPPLTESSPGSWGHKRRSACLGQPCCCLSACAHLYQKVTDTKYQGLFFLSKFPACCFVSKPESICTSPSDGCVVTSVSLPKKHLCVCFSWEVRIAKK